MMAWRFLGSAPRSTTAQTIYPHVCCRELLHFPKRALKGFDRISHKRFCWIHRKCPCHLYTNCLFDPSCLCFNPASQLHRWPAPRAMPTSPPSADIGSRVHFFNGFQLGKIWACNIFEEPCSWIPPVWAFYHIHMHAYMHEYIQTYRHTDTQTYRHTDTHAYTHTYVHTYIHTHTHTCMHAYMHTFIHTCAHAYIHTCIGACTGKDGIAWGTKFQSCQNNLFGARFLLSFVSVDCLVSLSFSSIFRERSTWSEQAFRQTSRPAGSPARRRAEFPRRAALVCTNSSPTRMFALLLFYPALRTVELSSWQNAHALHVLCTWLVLMVFWVCCPQRGSTDPCKRCSLSQSCGDTLQDFIPREPEAYEDAWGALVSARCKIPCKPGGNFGSWMLDTGESASLGDTLASKILNPGMMRLRHTRCWFVFYCIYMLRPAKIHAWGVFWQELQEQPACFLNRFGNILLGKELLSII